MQLASGAIGFRKAVSASPLSFVILAETFRTHMTSLVHSQRLSAYALGTPMTNPSSTEHEETLWSGSVSQWHYAGKWLTVVICLVVLAGTFFINAFGDSINPWIIRSVPLLVAVALIGWIKLDRSGRKYSVTNRRVSVEFGIISKQSTELRIQDIRSINLTTSGIAGLLGIGRLEFSSAASDDADVIFWNTPGAEKIRDLVRSLQSAAP